MCLHSSGSSHIWHCVLCSTRATIQFPVWLTIFYEQIQSIKCIKNVTCSQRFPLREKLLQSLKPNDYAYRKIKPEQPLQHAIMFKMQCNCGHAFLSLLYSRQSLLVSSNEMVPNHILITIYFDLWHFGFLLFLFHFCFSIYRDIWGTISWSIWCSEHWCRHLGNTRKAKQWLWCVTCISQALWHETVNGHLVIGLQNRFPAGPVISSESKFILLSPS